MRREQVWRGRLETEDGIGGLAEIPDTTREEHDVCVCVCFAALLCARLL